MKAYEQTLAFLKTLSLKGVANSLDEVISDAEVRKDSYITFLNIVLNTEIAYRIKRRVERNMVGAHFPVVKKIDNFDFGRRRCLFRKLPYTGCISSLQFRRTRIFNGLFGLF